MTINSLPNLWMAMDGCTEHKHHRFQLRHMCEHRQLAESLDGNGWVHGIPWVTISHQGTSCVRTWTICRIFELQWMGAWKHTSHRFQLRHMCDHRQLAESLDGNGWVHGIPWVTISHQGTSCVRTWTICRIFELQWMGAWKHTSHRFQLRHMCDHRQLAESLDGNGWVHGIPWVTISHQGTCVRTWTICRIFELQWMGAWKHTSHRFQLRHMCDHRQFDESLDCNGWAHGSTRVSVSINGTCVNIDNFAESLACRSWVHRVT